MAEALVVGGVLFWGIMVLWLLLLWWSTETDHGLLGFLSIVAYGCVLQWAFKVDVIGWILSHPSVTIAFLVFYLFVGAGWSFWRWYLFVKDQFEPYTKARADWLVSKNITNFSCIPENLKDEWGKYLKDSWEREELCTPPLVRDHKSRIMRWIGYWPINALTWAFNDMIRRFVKMVYEAIHDWLQAVSNRVFASVKNDLPTDYKHR